MLRNMIARCKTYTLLGVLAFAVSCNLALSEEGPVFDIKNFHSSDVRYGITFAPDNRTVSILFDNFAVDTLPGKSVAPTQTRTFSLYYPIKGNKTDTALAFSTRGYFNRDKGARGALILRLAGKTQVIELNSEPEIEINNQFETELPAGSGLQITVILIVERGAQSADGSALLTIDSIDVMMKDVNDDSD